MIGFWCFLLPGNTKARILLFRPVCFYKNKQGGIPSKDYTESIPPYRATGVADGEFCRFPTYLKIPSSQPCMPHSDFPYRNPTFLSPPSLRDTSPYHKGRHGGWVRTSTYHKGRWSFYGSLVQRELTAKGRLRDCLRCFPSRKNCRRQIPARLTFDFLIPSVTS